jgi:hypothetical protein
MPSALTQHAWRWTLTHGPTTGSEAWQPLSSSGEDLGAVWSWASRFPLLEAETTLREPSSHPPGVLTSATQMVKGLRILRIFSQGYRPGVAVPKAPTASGLWREPRGSRTPAGEATEDVALANLLCTHVSPLVQPGSPTLRNLNSDHPVAECAPRKDGEMACTARC